MANFDVARDALNTSLESSGSAMKEHAKWSDSLEARLLKLKATWQSFAQSFMDSSLLKGGIEALKVVLNLLDKLTQNLGSFGTIGLTLGIAGIVKNFSTLKIIFTSLKTGSIGAALGFKALATSASAVVGGIGLLVAGIGLYYNQVKKAKEAAAELRQETISASDEYFKAASSFESAYIKYSGRTDLTAEEESELESAIQGTVDALGDKSSALQNIVNSSNDYIASLEQIANAEKRAANDAAKKKLIAAEENLKESAIGWRKYDGSEVNIGFSSNANEDALAIAKEVGSEFWDESATGRFSKIKVGLKLDANADLNEILEYYYMLIEYQNKLEDAELTDTNEYDNVTAAIGKMSEAIGVYTEGVYEAAKAEYQLQNGIPKTAEEYMAMRESILSSMSDMSFETRKSIAGSMDSEYGQYFDLTSAEIQARKLIGVLDEYGDVEAGQIETFLNMRTAVNNNECTIGEYMSQFDKIAGMTSGWSEEAVGELNTSFGIDTDKIKEQYEDVEKYLKRQIGTDKQKSALSKVGYSLSNEEREALKGYYKDLDVHEERIENFLDGLSAYELQAVLNLKTEIDWQNASAEDIMAQIEKEAELVEAISFTVNLELEAEKLENLNTAISEAVSGAGLGSSSMSLVEDMFGDLDSYDPTKLFERTANGIRMNTDEFRKLNDEYKNNNIEGFDNKLSALAEEYNKTRDELTNLTYGSEEYNEKLRDLDNLESQINATEQLASQYRGLASAYQTWQMAESAGSQRDMYESMLEGLENVDDELSRGWLDDGTIEFLRLIKGENISATATTKELKAAYDSLDDTIKNTSYSVRDFFTVDEDGNSTNDGVYNFLDAIGQLEEEAFGGLDVVQRDGSGNIIGFDFQVAGGDKAIADALGISEELVQIMVRAADDAGFVVSMDGTYQQLDTLKDKAQEAANKLKELGLTTFGFDLNTGNEDSVFSQYEEALKIWEPFTKNKNADGTIDMTVEGAEEAFTLVSTLQSMVDKLSEPTYMKLDATQVEKDMKTPLSKLQEYERLTQQEHQLQLKGADTSELDKSQEEIIDYFEGLDPEIKAELGIKGLTREEIQAKVEAGEIEIPATIDLQVEMNQSMRDMVNVALYNAGLIDEEELKKRVDIELYAGEIDDSDVEEKVDETVEGEDGTRQKNIEIIAETFGSEDVDGLKTKLEGLDDTTIEAVANVIGQIDVEKLGTALKGLPSTTVQAIAEVLGKGDVVGLKEELNKLHPMKVQAIAEALGYESVEELNTAIENMDGTTVQAVAQALGLGDVNTLQAVIDGMHGNTVKAEVDTSGQADKVTSLQSVIDGLKGKVVNVVVNTIKNFLTGGSDSDDGEGGGVVNGTANANGTAFINGTSGKAFKQGDWRTKKTETALTGELGREIVVTPDNRWHTVGDNGAEFVNIPRGSIVFNHKQTEELLSNGRVTSGGGRGKALIGGTAYAMSSKGSEGFGGIGKVADRIADRSAEKVKDLIDAKDRANERNYSSRSSGSEGDASDGAMDKFGDSKSGSGSGGGSDAKDDFEEVIDWIEIAIARIEREIDRLDQKANNIYKNWFERNSALADEISKVGDEIELQQQAYDEYMDAAADVGLSEEYAEKVRNGTIDIETITDEELKEKVDEYQKWYENALSCQDAIEDLKETEAELYAQRVENAEKQFDGILGVIEHEKNMLEEYINQSEAQGWMVSYEYYRALSSVEKQNLAELEKQRDVMLEEFNAAMDSGTIEKGSEAYYDMVNAIDEVSLSIAEANTKVMEISQTAQQLKWEQFDLLQDKISAVTEETEFLIELLSSDKLYDDNGQLTYSGMATMGQHGVAYNTHMQQAEQAREEAERIQREIARNLYNGTDQYDTELEERYREMIALQQEHILAAQGEKEAIRDMVEEGIQLELDALSERIDKYNEALDSQKDLYDYQKKVKEQTEEIASLEKQIAAYRGDTSEETRAKIQELKVSLEDAREDLEETEYDKWISDQQELLDELYLEYETILNTRLDNIDALLSDMISEVNANASTISSTISEKAYSVGYTLSDSMKTIWDSNTSTTTNVITTYGEKFSSAQTTTNNALNAINSNLQNMINQLNTMAKTNVKSASTSSASKSSSNNNSNAKKTETKKKETKKAGDGTPKIGDKVKFVNGQYYYDSYGMKPLGSQKQGQYVYITNINKRNGATHPYHISTGAKLGNGDLGWLKLSQITGYSTGKYNLLDDEIAWTQEDGREFIVRPSDGAILTPVAKKDSILSANASNNIWNMANSPAEFIRDNLRFNSDNVPNGSAVYSNYTQHLDKVVFNLPNVKNYEELLSAMQKDKNFERLISSMTIDRLAGKSALVKGKSIH